MINLGERFTLTLPQGAISDAGIRLINDLVLAQRINSDDWKQLNPDKQHSISVFLSPLPDDWAWIWIVTGKGKYVGTFAKRVSKFYWKEHGLKCPDSFIQAIGNLARQHSSENVSYTFEFVDSFDWNAGDYGDANSCFWGGRAQARQILKDHNALAIRFYEADKGIGRAWIAQLEDNRYIIFNGYGLTANPTLVSARVFATWLGLNYKKISLCNLGKDSGDLYINGGIGYLISTLEQSEYIHEWDLRYGKQDDEDSHTCEDCGESVSEDDVYFGSDDLPYCQDCFYEAFDYCEHCGECHVRDNLYYVDSTGDVCESCLDERYTRCDQCYEYHRNDNVIYIQDESYCEDCLDRVATTCDNCNEWIFLDTAYSDDNGVFCEECRPKENNQE
jgi:formylmethanofuran dehydrogenase subunit E